MKQPSKKRWLWVSCVALGVFLCLPGLAVADNFSLTGIFAVDETCSYLILLWGHLQPSRWSQSRMQEGF